MKFLHFADLHLDASFESLGATGERARARRQALRDALKTIVRTAKTEKVDAVLCAGDLYEQQRLTPDTAEFVKRQFNDLSPIPILISPGNHDPMVPGSIYRDQELSANVHIFKEGALEPFQISTGLTVWGAAFTGPTRNSGFLPGFRVRSDGVHLALFHGSTSVFYEEEQDKQLFAPFTKDEILASGFSHLFTGHFHHDRYDGLYTYPGNPEPLGFGETPGRGISIAEVTGDGAITTSAMRIATAEIADLNLDVTGATTRETVLERLRELLSGRAGIIRVTVGGEVEQTLEFRLRDLAAAGSHLAAFQLRPGSLRPAYDLVALAAEPTVQGQFIRDVTNSPDLSEEDCQLVLAAGLRALDARKDLEVVS